jgi:HEAT repeat protein
MSGKDDRLVGDAAWALGEILAANPTDKRAASIAERWLYVAKHGGWAGAIDSAGGLARLLWALPKEQRAPLLAGTKRATLQSLVFHKSRLVRINAVHALASLAGDDEAAKALVPLLRDDPSAKVRIAAARGLARLGGSRATSALNSAAASDPDPDVKAAARVTAASPIPPRNEWRTYYVVDVGADDSRVRQEQYFVHTSDDVVWASYTDARGELTSEHVPAGDADVWPASREADY